MQSVTKRHQASRTVSFQFSFKMKCFVPSCNNRSDVQNWKRKSHVMKVTFHCFPKDPDTRSLWLDLLGIRVSEIPKRACICSMHFEETSFYSKGSYMRLKRNALPRNTINEEGTSCSDICENNMDTLSPNTIQDLIPGPEEIQSIVDTSNLLDECPLLPEPSTSNKENKETMVSPTFIYNSPEKVRLRERIKFVEADIRKKLFDTRRKLQRKEKKVVQLKNIIEDLKSKQLLNSDQTEMLSVLGGMGGKIFSCFHKKDTACTSKSYNAKSVTL